jgi:hypothetical protein
MEGAQVSIRQRWCCGQAVPSSTGARETREAAPEVPGSDHESGDKAVMMGSTAVMSFRDGGQQHRRDQVCRIDM